MIFFILLLFVTLSHSVRMQASSFSELVYFLVPLGVLPDSPRTQRDFQRLVDLDLTRPPECPLANELYTCDINGTITSLNITTATGGRRSSIAHLDVATDKTVVRNFVGTVTFTSLPSYTEFVDSVLLTFASPIDRFALLLSQATKFIFRNVVLPNYNFTVLMGPPMPMQLNSSRCQFINVTINCPVPQWLWPCFNATDVSPPCISRTGPVPFSDYGDEFPTCAPSGICSAECDPPPSADTICNPAYKPYFPSKPGFSTIVLYSFFVAEAIKVDFESVTRGLLVRIELWDWFTLKWVVLDFGATDRSEDQSNVPVPPVLTNIVRLTFEQWFPIDYVTRTALLRAQLGYEAPPIVPKVRVCAPGESFSERSMLDETLADSLCIGHLCQLQCNYAANFTFDRAVVPQFVVIEGGNLWPGATLVSTPSLRTRAYLYNVSSTPINVVAVPPEVGAVSRVRLIGEPVPGSGGLPSPTLPTQIGLPGIFVKRIAAPLPAGFLSADNSSCAAALRVGATVVSSARVGANVSFVFTSGGDLLRCGADGASWINETAAARLSRLTLNAGAAIPGRKLVAVDRQLLAVVSASSILHDGSVTRALVNRRILQTSVDVLDVATGLWFNNLLQHNIYRNISDIDVVANQNGSAFAVVDRASGEATVFEWRKFNYTLIPCSENTDCRSCLSNVANIELCRWCGTRCASQQVICGINEGSTRNVSLCPLPTTTQTTTSSAIATTNATAAPLPSAAASGFDSSDNRVQTSALMPVSHMSDPLIPLYAVLGAVGLLLLSGAIGAAVWRHLRRREDAPAARQEPIPLAPVAAQTSHYEDGDIFSGTPAGGAYESGEFNS
jgi:hypothetical protein